MVQPDREERCVELAGTYVQSGKVVFEASGSPLQKQLDLNLGIWIDFENWDELDDDAPKPYRNRISDAGR